MPADVVKIPDGILPRAEMPQIASTSVDDFIAWLRKKGIEVEEGKLRVGEMLPTQKDLDMEKVENLKKEPDQLHKRVIVSKDNRLLDGHHRFAALYLTDKNATLPTVRVDLPIRELIKLAHEFPDSFTKEIKESEAEIEAQLAALAERYQPWLDVRAEVQFYATKPMIVLQHLQARKDAPRGTGTAYMEELEKLADRWGMLITLRSATKGDLKTSSQWKSTSSGARLQNFYKRFGFKRNYGKRSYRPDLPGNMHRRAKAMVEEALEGQPIPVRPSELKLRGFGDKAFWLNLGGDLFAVHGSHGTWAVQHLQSNERTMYADGWKRGSVDYDRVRVNGIGPLSRSQKQVLEIVGMHFDKMVEYYDDKMIMAAGGWRAQRVFSPPEDAQAMVEQYLGEQPSDIRPGVRTDQTIALSDMDVEDWILDNGGDFNVQLPIYVLSPADVQKLTIDGKPVREAFEEGATASMKKLVARYMKSRLLESDPVILDGLEVMDGHHRTAAAVLSNQGLRAVQYGDDELSEDLVERMLHESARDHWVAPDGTMYDISNEWSHADWALDQGIVDEPEDFGEDSMATAVLYAMTGAGWVRVAADHVEPVVWVDGNPNPRQKRAIKDWAIENKVQALRARDQRPL